MKTRSQKRKKEIVGVTSKDGNHYAVRVARNGKGRLTASDRKLVADLKGDDGKE